MKTLTVAYAPPDEQTALRLAQDLQDKGYSFGEIARGGLLVAVISPEGIADNDLQRTIAKALDVDNHIVLVETKSTPLPRLIDHLKPISFQGGYKLDAVISEIERLSAANAPDPMVVLSPERRRRNSRFGWWFGGGIVLLFLLYTVAIAVFDLEAPIEEFERLYTRDAATINAYAQEYMPLSTEQAENFEITLESVNDELATIVVQTATQAATEGGFTPIPTGLIIAEPELSEVRQTATGGAILRERQTQQANLSDEDIAATATQAAVDANTELEQQQLTVTAANE